MDAIKRYARKHWRALVYAAAAGAAYLAGEDTTAAMALALAVAELPPDARDVIDRLRNHKPR